MRGIRRITTAVLFAGLTVGGCRQQLQVTTDFPLGDALGGFTVVAGEPTTKRGTGSIADIPITIGSGSLAIDPSVITIQPAPAKGGVNLQGGGTLVVTARIAALDQLDVVCAEGEEYGPFNVELDADYQPVSVDPSRVTLSQDTIDLINVGEFSICLEVTSPVSGEVTIESLTFRLGL